MAWTDQMVEDLKKMWKEGLTTGEIGKRLNVSKNSIVGKVHRLGLSGRPSPIKKKEEATPKATENKSVSPKPAPEKAAPSKAPAKTNVKQKPAEAPKDNFQTCLNKELEKNFLSPNNKEKKNNGFVTLTDLDSHTCRWPIGDPKDENFHFCGKKVKIGQTYCEEHAAIAYVKPSKK